jgi:hypothetical protein
MAEYPRDRLDLVLWPLHNLKNHFSGLNHSPNLLTERLTLVYNLVRTTLPTDLMSSG